MCAEVWMERAGQGGGRQCLENSGYNGPLSETRLAQGKGPEDRRGWTGLCPA